MKKYTIVLCRICSVIILTIITYLSSLKAQPYTFELLISWDDGDTSVMGLKAQELSDGNFIVLSNNQEYFSDPNSILIEGQLTLGTGLIQISEEGELLSKNHYNTNYEVLALEAQGRIPTIDFCTNEEDEIILPYSIFVGWLPCDSSIAIVSSFKKSILKTNSDGTILSTNTFPNDTLCDQDRIISIDKVGNEYFLLYEEREQDQVYLETFNEDLEIVSSTSIDMEGRWMFHDPYSSYLLSATQSDLSLVNTNGNIVNTFAINQPILQAPTMKLDENENYIAAVYHGFSSNPDRASFMILVDKANNQIKQTYFANEVLIDVAITENDKLLVLSDNSLFNFYDTLAQPIKVTLFDLNLNAIAEQNHGFPFVHPSSIETTSENGYIVTGTRLKSIDLINGKEPDQVYFLKGIFDELVDTENPININSFFSLYPNPTKGILSLKPNEAIQSGDAYFQLYNATGRLVFSKKLQKSQTNFSFDLSHLSKGIYFYKCNFNVEGVVNGKVILLE